MEAVIFMGIQACGKTTFYRARFADTHVRISLDMLRTRHREHRFIQTCFETQQRFVIDNTNVTVAERAQYVAEAQAARFRVIGYYFQSSIDACLARNQSREEGKRVPDRGVLGHFRRLELPTRAEGFDELYYVALNAQGGFDVQEWRDEV